MTTPDLEGMENTGMRNDYPREDFYFWLGEDGSLESLDDIGFEQKVLNREKDKNDRPL